jgi:hypothetical protein
MTTEELVRLDAEAMLPLIVEMFGDTELLQARRRAELQAEIVRRDPRRKSVAA